MADTTVEVTDSGESETVAETTAVQAVAETAKSEGAATAAADEARQASYAVESQAEQAEEAAGASLMAASVAAESANRAEQAANQTEYTLQGLGDQIARLTQVLESSLTPQTPVEDTTPSVVEVSETEPSKGHWLTRRVGRK